MVTSLTTTPLQGCSRLSMNLCDFIDKNEKLVNELVNEQI